MSTRPLGPPPILTDDPGPWSVISSVFAWAGGPGRRRAQPPMGLMISPAPNVTTVPAAGLDESSAVAGVCSVRVVAAGREPAHALRFEGEVLHGMSPYVLKRWSLPDLALLGEERPGDDPAAALPPAVHPASLGEPDLPGAVVAPDGLHIGVHTREPRAEVIAILRTADHAVVRWIRGARAVAWSDDGRLMAVGGEWGVLLAEAAPAGAGA